ncbi:hypothetical protein U1Q18_049371 [Sarracenia purpurea var. burkii]
MTSEEKEQLSFFSQLSPVTRYRSTRGIQTGVDTQWCFTQWRRAPGLSRKLAGAACFARRTALTVISATREPPETEYTMDLFVPASTGIPICIDFGEGAGRQQSSPRHQGRVQHRFMHDAAAYDRDSSIRPMGSTIGAHFKVCYSIKPSRRADIRKEENYRPTSDMATQHTSTHNQAVRNKVIISSAVHAIAIVAAVQSSNDHRSSAPTLLDRDGSSEPDNDLMARRRPRR